MSNELVLEALNEAWRELFPVPVVARKYVQVKRTDGLVLQSPPMPADLVWWSMKPKVLDGRSKSA